jgi:hypothetical protein
MRHPALAAALLGLLLGAGSSFGTPVLQQVVPNMDSVVGLLGVAFGGTNSTETPTSGAVAYGTGTAFAFSTAGSAGDCLKSGGTGTPTWGTCGGAGTTSSGSFTISFGNGAFSTFVSASATVTATWTTSGSNIVFSPKCSDTSGGNPVENCLISGISCTMTALNPGVSFTTSCIASGHAAGNYTISYVGS